MAETIVSTATGALGPGTSPSVTFPSAPLTDDIVVLFTTATVGGVTMNTIAGWTNLLGGTTYPQSASHAMNVVAHRVTAGEAGASTVTFTATNLIPTTINNVVGVVVRGVDLTTMVAGAAHSFSDANLNPHILTAVTPTASDGIILCAVAKDTSGTYTTPAGMTQINTVTGVAPAIWVGRYDALSVNAVTVGPTNITISATDQYVSITVVMKPLAASVTDHPASIASSWDTWTATATGTVPARLANDFNGGTDGAAITAVGSGGASGNAFDAMSGSGSAVYDDDAPAPLLGTMSALFAVTDTNNKIFSWSTSWGTKTQMWARAYLYIVARPTATTSLMQLAGPPSGSVAGCDVRLTAAGTLLFRDGAQVSQATSAVLALNTLHRVEWRVLHSDTVGRIEARIFSGANAHGTTPDQTLGSPTTARDTNANHDTFRWGVLSNPSTAGITLVWDSIAIDDTDWIGPAAAGASLTGSIASDWGTWTATAAGTVTTPTTDHPGSISSTWTTWTATAAGTVTSPGIDHLASIASTWSGWTATATGIVTRAPEDHQAQGRGDWQSWTATADGVVQYPRVTQSHGVTMTVMGRASTTVLQSNSGRTGLQAATGRVSTVIMRRRRS